MDEELANQAVLPETSVVAIDENEEGKEGENKMDDSSDVGSDSRSFSALTTDRNEEELDEADRLSDASDTGWDTDLEIEGTVGWY